MTLLGGTLSKEKIKDYIESLLEKNGENGEGDMLFRPFTLANFAGKEAANNLEDDLRQVLVKKTLGRYWGQLKLHLNYSTHSFENWFLPSLKVWRNYLEVLLLYHLKMSFCDLQDGEKNFLVMTLKELKYSDYVFVKEFISHLKNPQIDSKIRQEIAWIIYLSKKIKDDDIEILWTFLKKAENDEDIQRPISKILSKQKGLSKEKRNYISKILSKDDGKLEYYEKKIRDSLDYKRDFQADEKLVIQLLLDKNKEAQDRAIYADIINSWIEIGKETGEIILDILIEDDGESDISFYLCEAVHNIKEFSSKGIQKLFQIVENENIYYSFKYAIIDKLAEAMIEKREKVKLVKILRDIYISEEYMMVDWEKQYFLEDLLKLANQLMCPIPLEGEIVVSN